MKIIFNLNENLHFLLYILISNCERFLKYNNEIFFLLNIFLVIRLEVYSIIGINIIQDVLYKDCMIRFSLLCACARMRMEKRFITSAVFFYFFIVLRPLYGNCSSCHSAQYRINVIY
jgi:hypothetical protein